MQGKDLTKFIVDYGDSTLWRDSLAMGNKGQYLDSVVRRGGALGVDKLADLAELHDLRVALVNPDGEILVTVDSSKMPD